MTEKQGYNPSPDRYWAAEDPEYIAAAIRWRFDRYQQRIRDSGRVQIWKIADLAYHGRSPDGGYANAFAVSFGGEQGEIAQMHVGYFRRLLKGWLSLATSQRPAIETTARSNDPAAVASTQIARQLLEYDLDEGVEDMLRAAHERALVYSEGYVVQTWDFHGGREIGTQPLPAEAVDTAEGGLPAVESGADAMEIDIPVREGAVKVEVRSPLDVARDLDLDRVDDQPWHIVRTRAHRWDLAARYPEDAEKRRAILEAPRVDATDWTIWTTRSNVGDTSDSDYIHMLTLYHQPSEAMPAGRIVEVVGDVALSDAPYPYDHCVVHADIPSAELDRSVGHGDAWALLAISQALDAVESDMLTVADAGAGVNWTAPRGQKVDTRQLEGGMKLVEYDDDGRGSPPPGLMERPAVRETDFKLSEHYVQHLRTISGQNSVVQGEPDPNITSGNHSALIASMAVKAIDDQIASYARLLRSTMDARVSLYRTFATEPRLIEISGKDKTGMVTEFVGADLGGVRRVKVEIADPVLRTIHGKVEIADRLLERYGPETITLDRYFALLHTGRLDDLDPTSIVEHKLIARRENEMFRDGEGERVQVMLSDHHACHIAEHLRDINDISVRYAGDEQGVQRLQQRLAHLQEHLQLWPTTPPELLMATGQSPAPSAEMGPPGGAPGGPPPDGEPPVPPPPDGAPEMGAPGMPSLPTNPMTGETGVPEMGVTQ